MSGLPGAPKTVAAYLAAFPRAEQVILEKVRREIQRAVPAAEEGISYGMIGYRYHGPLVYFAAQKNHYTLHAARVLDPALRGELAAYELTKGGVHFPKGKPVPLRVIARVAKARARENEEKAAQNQASRSSS